MAVIDYAVKYSNIVDERFKAEAKSEGFVNNNYSFVGAKTVKVYNISTAKMNDYARNGGLSRYGTPEDLDAGTQEMTMTQDRSFTFVIDKMDNEETNGELEAGKALARQLREVVVPEIDTYRFNIIGAKAGEKASATLTSENIYDEILKGTAHMEEKEVPLVGRQLGVTPAVYSLMKKSKDIVMDTEIGQEMRKRGVVAIVDDMEVVRVPKSRLKADFIMTHPMASPSPVKLAEYKIHTDAPGISGKLVEGRVYYDCFVLDNKKDIIYVCNKEEA